MFLQFGCVASSLYKEQTSNTVYQKHYFCRLLLRADLKVIIKIIYNVFSSVYTSENNRNLYDL
jgi:hypothetical protein